MLAELLSCIRETPAEISSPQITVHFSMNEEKRIYHPWENFTWYTDLWENSLSEKNKQGKEN